jgi:hypothetical protein
MSHTLLKLLRLVRGWWATADFGVNDKPVSRPALTKAGLRRTWIFWRVIACCIKLPVAPVVETVQESLDFFFAIVVRNAGFPDSIPNLDLESDIDSLEAVT